MRKICLFYINLVKKALRKSRIEKMRKAFCLFAVYALGF